MASVTRLRGFLLYFNDEELSRLKALAKAAGMPASRLIRSWLEDAWNRHVSRSS